MGSECIGDVVEIVMGQSPPGESCNCDGLGVPLLNGPTEFGSHHPDPVQYTTDARKLAKVGDLLFCVRGSTTGRMNWADRQYAIGRGIAAIRHKLGPDLQPFVRSVVENYLPQLLAQATGSTFPNVSYTQLASIPWPSISEPEMRRVAHILGTLDDKIELNRQMNKTLEEMARALFKSWFVDFDPVRAKMSGRWTRTTPLPGLPTSLFDLFPDHLVDSALGEIPVGWEVGCLGDEFVITMGQSPPGDTYNESGEGIPFFQGRSDFGFRYPLNRVFCTSPTRFAEGGDTLVSVRAPVGDINMAFERCCVGRGVAAVRHRSGVTTYTYYKMASFKQLFMDFDREGTVFGAINKDAFNGLPSVVVPEPVLQSFEATVCSMEYRLGQNEIESRWLTELRQELIGHLLSGARALEAL